MDKKLIGAWLAATTIALTACAPSQGAKQPQPPAAPTAPATLASFSCAATYATSANTVTVNVSVPGASSTTVVVTTATQSLEQTKTTDVNTARVGFTFANVAGAPTNVHANIIANAKDVQCDATPTG